MGVKLAVLPDAQPPTAAFNMLAKLCGPKADGTEVGTVLSIKMAREGLRLGYCRAETA